MNHIIKALATGFVALFLLGVNGAVAQVTLNGGEDDGTVELLAELANPDAEHPEKIEEEILDRWSKSGSRSMDLLLERGRDALKNDDIKVAIEHLTALTDHAPDFAEGWNARATAFFELDEYGLSIADISRALALNPMHFDAMTGLGIMLEQMEQHENALLVFREVQRINPHRDRVNEAIDRLSALVDDKSI